MGAGIADRNANFGMVKTEKILQMSLKVTGDIKDFNCNCFHFNSNLYFLIRVFYMPFRPQKI